MTQTKHERFRELMRREGIGLSRPEAVPRRDGPREGEASYPQGSIWINQMLDADNTAYNILLAMRVGGRLSIAATAQVLQTIVDRHEALRTSFKSVAGKPHQIAAARLPADVRIVDLRGHDELLQTVLADLQRTKLSLDRGPLFAFTVIRLASHVHVVALVLHHIVFDFVSSQLLCDEFGQLYRRYTSGQPHGLAALRIQYLDYTAWQRTRFEQSSANVLRAWQEALGTGDRVPTTDLPSDRPSAHDGFQPAVEKFVAPAGLAARVAAVSRETGVSAFCVWLAAFQVLLHRYTDADDVVLCVPHGQRDDPDAEHLIGCFINLIVVRLQVRPRDSFRQVLRAVHDDYLDAVGVRACPFDKLIEALAPTRREGVLRLGEIAFAYQRGGRAAWDVGPLRVSILDTPVANAKLAFSVSLYENADECRGLIEYDGARFSTGMARRMMGQYLGLLSSLVASPDQPIGAVADVAAITPTAAADTAADTAASTAGATAAHADDDDDDESGQASCLHAAFERQARTTPDASALVMDGAHLTYRALDARANQLARRLMRDGLGLQQAVGLRLPRSPEAYLWALAILKAGGIFVPLDPSHPAAYVLHAIDVAEVGRVIVAGEHDDIAVALDGRPVRVSNAAALAEASRDESDRHPGVSVSDVDTAYVYFTSGSTGDSKGVFVSHGAIAAHMQAFLRAVPIDTSDRVLQFASLTFDVSLEQIFSAWSSGAALLPRGDEIWSVREFLDVLAREQVTIANPPTAYWNQVVRVAAATGERLPRAGLRCMIAGGEAMLSEVARRWTRISDDGVRLVNAYGPTEAVVTATYHDVPAPDAYAPGTVVPIGRPLPGVVATVLDRHGLSVPSGAAGELGLSGSALAHGYLANPRLTADRFRPSPGGGPDSTAPGARLYRTGDWVRESDGVLEYLARKDDEVKIRGVRVTTTRIESVLLEHDRIAEAAVVVRRRPAMHADAALTSSEDEREWQVMLARLPAAFVESSIAEAERADGANAS